MQITRQRIARLCELYGDPSLAPAAAAAGVQMLLDRLVATIGANDAASAARAPDTVADDLDALDDALAAQGIDAGLSGTRDYEPLPGLGGGHPVVEFWRCPTGKCDRRIWHSDGEPDQTCALSGRLMRQVRVST
jgi:hypothetical protein